MRYVDLSLEIHEGMATYPAPWHPVVEVTQLGRHGFEGRETRRLVMGTHTGTHVDAPSHFLDHGNSVDMYELSHLCGKAIAVDLTDIPSLGEVTQPLLAERVGGRNAERVLLNFGWGANIWTKRYYDSHPYLTMEAIAWLMDVGCFVLGMDSPSPDDPRDPIPSNHYKLLSSGCALVEGLTRLYDIQDEDYFTLIVAPLNIVGGDGAPARVFAIVED